MKWQRESYSFAEILAMKWQFWWEIKFEHPDFIEEYYKERFPCQLDDFIHNLGHEYDPSDVHKILSESKFYIFKE